MDDNQFLIETQAQQAALECSRRASTTARIAILGAVLFLCSLVLSATFGECSPGRRQELEGDLERCRNRLDVTLERFGWPAFEPPLP